MTRLADAKVVLAENDSGHYQPVGRTKRGLDRRASFGPRGQGVGVEDHARSSGESLSNSSSIESRTRRFSSERSDNAPKPAIHRGSALPERFARADRRSCSSSASVKSRLKVTPRAAASALACRNTTSGSSMVVFIWPYFHKYGLIHNRCSRSAFFADSAPRTMVWRAGISERDCPLNLGSCPIPWSIRREVGGVCMEMNCAKPDGGATALSCRAAPLRPRPAVPAGPVAGTPGRGRRRCGRRCAGSQ